MTHQLEIIARPDREAIQPAPQAAVAQTAAPVSRLFFVDMLRTAMIVLVVLHHIAITYSAVAPWYYVEFTEDFAVILGFLAFVLMNQAYFMGLLFLIAGYFTPGSFDRKRPRRFLRDRFVRLGIPLVVYILLLNPLASFAGYTIVTQVYMEGAELSRFEFYLVTLNAGPLWFLEVLLFFILAYAGWRWLRGRSAPAEATARNARAGEDAPDALAQPFTFGAVAGFIAVLALVTFVWRIWVPMGAFLPVLALPTPSHMPQYVALFVVGTLAYRRNWLLTIPPAMGKVGIGVALLATVLLFPFALAAETWMGGVTWPALAYATWEAIFAVGMCLALLTFFRRHFNRPGRWGQFLSDHAYAVFIIHGPVIAWLGYSLQGVDLHPAFKFVLASAMGLPLCFAAAYAVRKLPGARRIL